MIQLLATTNTRQHQQQRRRRHPQHKNIVMFPLLLLMLPKPRQLGEVRHLLRGEGEDDDEEFGAGSTMVFP